MYLTSVSFNNIALLFLYANSTRFLLFDYKITAILWEKLLLTVKEKYELSTKRSKTVKIDSKNKEKELIIYSPNVPPNIYWLGLYKTLEKLLNCPFCKGCWAGYIIYLLFIMNFNSLVIDIRQVMDFAIFAWCCGWLSLISNQKFGI